MTDPTRPPDDDVTADLVAWQEWRRKGTAPTQTLADLARQWRPKECANDLRQHLAALVPPQDTALEMRLRVAEGQIERMHKGQKGCGSCGETGCCEVADCGYKWRIDQAEAQLAALRAQIDPLVQFMRHHDDCATLLGRWENDDPDGVLPQRFVGAHRCECTCGLADTLDALGMK